MNCQVARHVRLDSRELRLRQSRTLGDVGNELDRLGAVLRQHVGRDCRHVRTDTDAELPAHRGKLARQRLAGQRRRALAQHVASEVGQPHLIFGFIDVASFDDETDRDLGHEAEGHHGDWKAV